MKLAVGFFDGVHLGHRQILDGADAVFTFRNHPACVLTPGKTPPLLMTCEERIEALKTAGMPSGTERSVHAVRFTNELASMPALDFAEELKKSFSGLERIHCGANWRFGRNGEGTPEVLRGCGLDVKVVECAEWGGERISSTRIRKALQEGRLSEANAMLGRPYAAGGTVERGKGMGGRLGAATLNVRLSAPLKAGVYAVRTDCGDGVANYGHAPTMGEAAWREPVLEVHLLDGGTLKDSGGEAPERLRAEFLEFVRPERKFGTVEELRRQIAEDVRAVRAILS